MARDRRLALALAMIIFFTIWIKLSSLWFSFCNSAKMDGRRPSQKYSSIISLIGALTRSYAIKINYKCWRCAANSNTDFCWYWKTRLNWLRMLLAKAQSFPRFIWKKSLNSPYVIESLALEQRFYWCHYWTIALWRNEVAKGTQFDLLSLLVLK